MKTPKKAVRKAAKAREKAKSVKVTVEHGNVLKAAGDVLALKYAQARHGADRGAAEAFRAAGQTLPKPKEWEAAKLVDSPKGITARQTLVVGTHPLWESEPEFRYQFGLRDVRRLNERFLSALADHPVKSVVTTPHGEGVDLDLYGVFDSAIKGFQSAIKNGQFPPTLERVSIVTKNPEKRHILEQRLGEILPSGVIEVGTPAIPAPLKWHDVFVVMSSDPELDDEYHQIMAGVHEVKGGNGRALTCMRFARGDDDSDGLKPGALLPQIFRKIESAKFIIAVLTPNPGNEMPRPNVCFEAGYAYKVKKPERVLLVAKEGTKIRKEFFSDLAGAVWTEYKSPNELKGKIRRKVEKMEEDFKGDALGEILELVLAKMHEKKERVEQE